jgi:hypothetical protein
VNKAVSKEEVVSAIKTCAENLGRAPSLTELRLATKVHERDVRKHFLTYKLALAECGMSKEGPGYKVPVENLFQDWAELARKLKKVPNITEYDMYSKYSHRPLVSRFGNWRQAQIGLLTMAEENGWDVQWKEQVDVLREHIGNHIAPTWTSKRKYASLSELGIFTDRPIYGPPVVQLPLAHGPVNEMGVVFLFGALAEKLGFIVTRIQPEFPDGEAMWEIQPGIWQRVRIEFEYESKNFVKHMHKAENCDVLVCWVHNWPECPLRVVELNKELSLKAAAMRPKVFGA